MTCRFCGLDKPGKPFKKWVSPKFTNWDDLLPGDSVCDDCLFWFDEASGSLAKLTGKWWPTMDAAVEANEERVKRYKKNGKALEQTFAPHDGGWCIPQRMRNYSHFIVNGEWAVFSKAEKPAMRQILLGTPFPEVAIVAESAQKYIAFRGLRAKNPPGSVAGWVQFEEERLWVEPARLANLLETVETLMTTFSKTQIETGDYQQYYIIQFGFSRWMELEDSLKKVRGTPIFRLAVFLGQKTAQELTATNTEVSPQHTEGETKKKDTQLSMF